MNSHVVHFIKYRRVFLILQLQLGLVGFRKVRVRIRIRVRAGMPILEEWVGCLYHKWLEERLRVAHAVYTAYFPEHENVSPLTQFQVHFIILFRRKTEAYSWRICESIHNAFRTKMITMKEWYSHISTHQTFTKICHIQVQCIQPRNSLERLLQLP